MKNYAYMLMNVGTSINKLNSLTTPPIPTVPTDGLNKSIIDDLSTLGLYYPGLYYDYQGLIGKDPDFKPPKTADFIHEWQVGLQEIAQHLSGDDKQACIDLYNTLDKIDTKKYPRLTPEAAQQLEKEGIPILSQLKNVCDICLKTFQQDESAYLAPLIKQIQDLGSDCTYDDVLKCLYGGIKNILGPSPYQIPPYGKYGDEIVDLINECNDHLGEKVTDIDHVLKVLDDIMTASKPSSQPSNPQLTILLRNKAMI